MARSKRVLWLAHKTPHYNKNVCIRILYNDGKLEKHLTVTKINNSRFLLTMPWQEIFHPSSTDYRHHHPAQKKVTSRPFMLMFLTAKKMLYISSS
jgi:hypothetical protein